MDVPRASWFAELASGTAVLWCFVGNVWIRVVWRVCLRNLCVCLGYARRGMLRLRIYHDSWCLERGFSLFSDTIANNRSACDSIIKECNVYY